MLKIRVTVDADVVASPGEGDDDIIDCLDRAMEELLDLDDAVDPSMDLDLENYHVSFSVTVEAPNPFDAVNQARCVVRSAIHAAGGGTPDWPDTDDDLGTWNVRATGVSTSGDQDGELITA